MTINVSVQYKDRSLPDNLLLTQAPIFVWFDDNNNSHVLWWLCMAINISVQYNGGLLPDIILLTQGYYHRGTHLNTMWWLCFYSLCNSILLRPCLIYSNSFVLFSSVSLHGD